MDWLAQKLNIRQMEDWYQITTEEIVANGGRVLLLNYGNSIVKLLQAVYSEYSWKEWFFLKTSKHFWDDFNNQILYMKWLFDHLGFKDVEDWYSISSSDFINNLGRGILNKYNNSPSRLIMSVITNHQWIEWRFESTSPKFWHIKANQVKYLQSLYSTLNYK